MTNLFDALTPIELGALLDRLRAAERRSLGAARTAADADVWPLVRVAGDLRALIDDAATTEHRDMATEARP